MALRATTGNIDDYGRTHLIEIHDSEWSGSVTELANTGRGYASFEHQKIDPRNPWDNPIQKGVLEFSVWLQSGQTGLVDDLKSGDEKRFHAVHKIDGSEEWKGYIYFDLSSFEENEEPYRLTLTAKDFTDLGGKDFLEGGLLPDSRETVIETIAALLNTVGFSLPIRTHTSWIEEHITSSQDYLRQIYHETKALRDLANSGDETDQPLTVEEALNKLLSNHKLILKQANGAYYIDQLTAHDDPTSVLETQYDLTGSVDNDGLVSLWRFDGDVTDSAGSNDGTIVGDPQFVSGVSGQALEFDGVDDYVSVLGDPFSEDGAISFHVKANWSTINDNEVRMVSTDHPNGSSNEIRTYSKSNLSLIISSNGVTSSISAFPSNLPNDDTWYHIVYQWKWDGATLTLEAYRDGVLQDTSTMSEPFPSGANDLRFGTWFNSNFFAGTIDEPRIYSRALSEAEIQELYENPGGSKNLTIDANTDDLKVVIQQDNRDNSGLPGLRKSEVKFFHRTKVGGIKLPVSTEIVLQDSQSKPYDQLFLGDGTQEIALSYDARANFDESNSTAQTRFQIKIDNTWYLQDDGSWDTASNIVESDMTFTKPFPDGSEDWRDSYSDITDPIPDAADGTMVVTFYGATGSADFATETEYISPSFEIRNSVASEQSQHINYQLTQTGNYSIVQKNEDTWFGDGPTAYSISALRYTTNDGDTTSKWQRRGSTPDRSFHENYLKEPMDLLRGWRRLLTATLKGTYKPHQTLAYDSEYLFYLGGSQDIFTGNWSVDLFRINVATATDDTFEDIPKFSDESETGSTTPSTGGGSGQADWNSIIGKPDTESEWATETDFDNRYANLADDNTWTGQNTFNDYIAFADDGRMQGDGAGAIEALANDGTNNGIFRVDKIIANRIEVAEEIDQTNTNELHISDQYIKVNEGVTGTPSLNGGLYVERGNLSDAYNYFDEGQDRWGAKFGSAGSFDPFILESDIFPDDDYQNLGTGDDVAFRNVWAGKSTDSNPGLTDTTTFSDAGGFFVGNAGFILDADLSTLDIVSRNSLTLWTNESSGAAVNALDFTSGGDATFNQRLTAANGKIVAHENGYAYYDVTGTNFVFNTDASTRSFLSISRGSVGDTGTTNRLWGLRISDKDDLQFITDTGGGVDFWSSISNDNEGFTTGFLGNGWKMYEEASEWNFETDVGFFRSALFAQEFIINQITATQGSRIASAGRGKVEVIVDPTAGSEIVEVSDPSGSSYASYSVNDICLCLRTRGDLDTQTTNVLTDSGGVITKRYVRKVTDVTGNQVTFTTPSDAPSDAGAVAVGDVIVVIGSSSSNYRSQLLYETVIEQNAPYTALKTQVNSWTDYKDNNTLRMKYGNLNGSYGYTADTFGMAVGPPDQEHATFDHPNGVRFIDGSGNIGAQFNSSLLTLGDKAAGNFVEFDVAAGTGNIELDTFLLETTSLFISDQNNGRIEAGGTSNRTGITGAESGSGGSDSITFWSGGLFADRETAPIWIKRGGDARFANGVLTATSSEVGLAGFTADSSKIIRDSGGGNLIQIGSNTLGGTINMGISQSGGFGGADNFVRMFDNLSGTWGMQARDTGGNEIFTLGWENKIAGWKFDTDTLWSGGDGTKAGATVLFDSSTGQIYYDAMVVTVWARNSIAAFTAGSEAGSLDNQEWETSRSASSAGPSQKETKIKARYRHRYGLNNMLLNYFIRVESSGDGTGTGAVYLTVRDSGGVSVASGSIDLGPTGTTQDTLTIDISSLNTGQYYTVEADLEAQVGNVNSGTVTITSFMREDALIYATT